MHLHYTFLRYSLSQAILLSVALQVAHAEDSVSDHFQQLLPNFTSPDQAKQKEARETWERHCSRLGSPGSEQRRNQACGSMVESLLRMEDRSTRLFLLRQIERIGGDEVVDGLSELLGDNDPVIVDAARRALAKNGSTMATEVLRAMLAKTEQTEPQVSLIHALSYRNRGLDASFLEQFLGSDDRAVIAASANAIARIGSDEAVELLRERLELPNVDGAINEAAIKLATTRRDQGDRASARMLFDSVAAANATGSLRSAAMRGSLSCLERGAGQKVLALLAESDPDLVEIAVGSIRELDEHECAVLIEGESQLPDVVRAKLFVALAARRYEAAAGPFMAVARSGEAASLRAAAIESIGKVGDSGAVPMLLTLLDETAPEISGAAESALATIWDEKGDQLILQALDASADAPRRATLTNILSRRRTPELADRAIGDLVDDDPQVRSRAVAILSRLGGTQHLADALRVVDQISGEEFNQFSKAIVAICRRIPSHDSQTDPVIALYSSSPPTARGRILSIIGTIGGEKAAEFIKGKLNSGAASEVEAAVTALANWPDASVSQTLLEIARNGETESQRTRAIRGIARVVVLPNSPLSDPDQLEMLKQAMRLAIRVDERKLILDRAAAIDLIDAVRFLRPYLDDRSLRDVACKSIVQIGRIKSLRTAHPELIDDLKRVIEVTEDQKVRQRAEKAISDT